MTTPRFNPLDYSSHLLIPEHLSGVDDWHGHIPIAFMLIEILRPSLVVELGVYAGDSYFAWCQSAQILRKSSLHDIHCFGIDTFKGDADMGSYSEGIYLSVSQHNKKYENFSTIIRSTFDESVESFQDGSIDLLHIDGCHDFAAVEHDFETYYPKLSPKGVVVFHDIIPTYAVATKKKIIGAAQFWDILKTRFPNRSFEFYHSFGLGILAPNEIPNTDLACLINSANTPDADLIRQYFSVLQSHIKLAEISYTATRQQNSLYQLVREFAPELADKLMGDV